MDEDALKKLLSERAGRGVWIGLLPRDGDVGDGIKDPHVTLAHLGRDRDEEFILAAMTTCNTIAASASRVVAKVDGSARLEQSRGSAMVLLLRDDHFLGMVENVRGELADRDLGFDQRFPFRAHLTIAKIKPEEPAVFERQDPKRTITFDRLVLVVGDNRVEWQLNEAPF